MTENQRWEFVLSRKIGLFEMLCADEAYKRLPFDLKMDYVAVSRDGIMRRYNSLQSMRELADAIRANKVAPVLTELSGYDGALSLILSTDPFENRKAFIEAIYNTWIYEIFGYYVGEFTTDPAAIAEGQRLRGTHNAQHLASTEFVPKLFEEVSIRTGIPKELIKYATPQEIIDMDLDEGDLKKRKQLYALVLMDNVTCVYTCTEAEAKIVELNVPDPSLDGEGSTIEAQTVRGSGAFKGMATGRVVIVNDEEDMYKIHEGDILISIMTRTTLVSGMKKAAAIVTDEGGLTCHAAIVARELKKPCIVGTKIATQVFKDGDLVEVDAEKGIIRKL